MSLSYAFDPDFRAIPGSSSPLELREMIQNPFRFLEQRYTQHGPIFRSSVAYPCVWMIGPEANRTIMVTERDKFSYEGGYGKLAFARLFPRNILLMDGDVHARTRAILEPAVSRLGLEESIGPVQEIWDAHAASLGGQEPADVYTVAQRATYEVSARVLAGRMTVLRRFASIDPGLEIVRGEVGEGQQQVAQVTLRVDGDHRTRRGFGQLIYRHHRHF